MHMLPNMHTLPEPQHWIPQRWAPKPQQTMSSMQRSLGPQMLRPHSTLPLAAMKTPVVQQQRQQQQQQQHQQHGINIFYPMSSVLSCLRTHLGRLWPQP
jgi:hypothetical protein